MMPNRRGYRLRPLTDSHGSQITRAEILANERMGDTGYQSGREQRVPRDPGLVARVVELQRRAS